MTSKMSKKAFLIRFALYCFFGAVIPFAFVTWRFKLFGVVSSISIGGWGIIAILTVAIFFIKMMNAVKKGLPYSTFSRILDGLCKCTIPLLAASLILYYCKDFIEDIVMFMELLFVSESIAMLVNPIPDWTHENKLNEQETTLKTVFESLWSIKSGDSK